MKGGLLVSHMGRKDSPGLLVPYLNRRAHHS